MNSSSASLQRFMEVFLMSNVGMDELISSTLFFSTVGLTLINVWRKFYNDREDYATSSSNGSTTFVDEKYTAACARKNVLASLPRPPEFYSQGSQSQSYMETEISMSMSSSAESEYDLHTLHDWGSQDEKELLPFDDGTWEPPINIVVEKWIPNATAGGDGVFYLTCRDSYDPELSWCIKKSYLDFRHLKTLLELDCKIGLKCVFPHVEDPTYRMRRMGAANIEQIRLGLAAYLEELCASREIMTRSTVFHAVMEFVNTNEDI